MSSTLESLPLREKFTNAERLTRELIEHLEQGFLPKLKKLRGVTRKDDESVTDRTVRDHCKRLLDSDDFTHDLADKLQEYLDHISRDMNLMVYGE